MARLWTIHHSRYSTTNSGGIEKTNFDWFLSRRADFKKDLTLDSEWGDGEQVFLSFAIHDTGQGLTVEEKARLYQRFTVSTFLSSD